MIYTFKHDFWVRFQVIRRWLIQVRLLSTYGVLNFPGQQLAGDRWMFCSLLVTWVCGRCMICCIYPYSFSWKNGLWKLETLSTILVGFTDTCFFALQSKATLSLLFWFEQKVLWIGSSSVSQFICENEASSNCFFSPWFLGFLVSRILFYTTPPQVSLFFWQSRELWFFKSVCSIS